MNNKASSQEHPHLEPRVAKLETGLEILTRDVSNLANIVREQGRNIESEIQKLAIGVTAASGPRKTDWSTIISAILLIMAIGSAVFWPLNQTTSNNKAEIKALQDALLAHKSLDNHPVGAVEIKHLESDLSSSISINSKSLEALDKKIQRENELIANDTKSQLNALTARYDNEIQNLGDRILMRLNAYDQQRIDDLQKDREELRQWQMRAMMNDMTK